MALKLELQQQKQESEKLVQHLVAHVSHLSNRNRTPYKPSNDNNRFSGQKHDNDGTKIHSNYPPWMTIPPTHPAETKLVDRKIYTWCTKCRQGQGLWVCRHNTETHMDGYTHQRNTRRRVDFDATQSQHPRLHQDGMPTRGRLDHNKQSLNPVCPTHHQTAQLSLLDYLDDYLPADETHADEEPFEESPESAD